MSPKAFLALVAVTVVCVVAAGVGVTRYYGAVQPERVEAPVFPELEEKANEVAEIAIRDADGAFTVRRGDAGWVVTEKNGYPARTEAVRGAVVQLSQLRLTEAKTQLPELYTRIEVEDLDAEGSKAKWIQLKDAGGQVLAELIVGKQKHNLARPGGSGVYIRRPGETQAWLAKGALELNTDPTNWLERQIIDLPAERVQRVTTTDAEGTALIVSRDTVEQEDFQVSAPPEGAELKDDVNKTLKDMAAALADLRLNDVAPEEEMDFDGDGVVRAEVVTFDGWVVDVAMIEKDEDSWARFEITKADSDSATDAEQTSLEEAASRVEGWAYKVPDFKVKNLKLRMTDLLKGKEGDDKSS